MGDNIQRILWDSSTRMYCYSQRIKDGISKFRTTILCDLTNRRVLLECTHVAAMFDRLIGMWHVTQ